MLRPIYQSKFQHALWKAVEHTDQCREEHAHRSRDGPVAPYKRRVRRASQDTIERTRTEVLNGADHVVEPHEICSPQYTEDDRAEKCPNKTLDSFLG